MRENARLVALSESNGIEWRLPPEPSSPSERTASKLQNGEAKTVGNEVIKVFRV